MSRRYDYRYCVLSYMIDGVLPLFPLRSPKTFVRWLVSEISLDGFYTTLEDTCIPGKLSIKREHVQWSVILVHKIQIL